MGPADREEPLVVAERSTAKPEAPGEYLTPREIAGMLRVSEPTVRGYCRDGTIPAARFGTKWRVRREDLEALFGR
jgi:excisionase family DNA binding protein